MSSTSISSVLFTLLILILQTLTTVSALPTCTPAAGAGPRLETRASNSDNNNSNSDNSDNGVHSNDTAASNKVTPAQIAGLVIGALCTIALALIFWYCFLQHQSRKRAQRALDEKEAAIKHTKRVDNSYESTGGIYRPYV
ncbi:unnamed protein product [Tuber melanosporum]|jgi:beta-lactamase regulating signal transducer with metallopeptidase domain|uniref:(Perigord truffle) hypothetical protein n=1 Tax=Tuber melanosporum (strain Mel28) TaxID=656061 RepID=D5G5B2_TUBMM|nr:uncharacterized protein GSTUM_00004255001 [Tuber melanosporum]CAZ79705.1 unnamed protein product [Tuber melanosporum]